METLKDYKPLEKVVLPRIGNITCSGLIVVVGPNSSGKTQLLQDLYQRMSGEPRALVVAESIVIRTPPAYGDLMLWLEKNRYVESFVDDSGNSHWRPLTFYIGTGQAIGQIAKQQGQNLHSNYTPIPDPKEKRRSEFLNYFGRMLPSDARANLP